MPTSNDTLTLTISLDSPYVVEGEILEPIQIPSHIQHIIIEGIKYIAEEAFYKLGDDQLLSVDMLNTEVEYINKGLFSGHKSLSKVVLPKKLLAIDSRGFKGCESLKSIGFPSCLQSIGEEAFSECIQLTDLLFPGELQSIGHSAFKDCISLNRLVIPESVDEVGESAFYDCVGLVTVEVKAPLSKIEEMTFCGCKALIDVTLPETLTEIEASAFCDCHHLTSINLPNSVCRIWRQAFRRCRSLSQLILPNQLDYLGYSVFSSCVKLQTLEIPETLVEIDRRAFKGCNSLKALTIPSGVVYLGEGAFECCAQLSPDNVLVTVKFPQFDYPAEREAFFRLLEIEDPMSTGQPVLVAFSKWLRWRLISEYQGEKSSRDNAYDIVRKDIAEFFNPYVITIKKTDIEELPDLKLGKPAEWAFFQYMVGNYPDRSFLSFLLEQKSYAESVVKNFDVFYQHYNKVNGKADKQHQLAWGIFESKYLEVLLMLVDLGGAPVFTWLTSLVANTCQPLLRALDQMLGLPKDIVTEVQGVFNADLKSEVFGGKDLEVKQRFISFMACLVLMTSSNNEGMAYFFKEYRDRLVAQIFESKAEERFGNFEACYQFVVKKLCESIVPVGAFDVEVDFDELLQRFPAERLVDLMYATKSINRESESYSEIYFAMVLRDLLPELFTGGMNKLLFDQGQELSEGKQLAAHNVRILERFKQLSISPPNEFGLTDDFTISVENPLLAEMGESCSIMMRYLAKLTEHEIGVKPICQIHCNIEKQSPLVLLTMSNMVLLDKIDKAVVKRLKQEGAAEKRIVFRLFTEQLHVIKKHRDALCKTKGVEGLKNNQLPRLEKQPRFHLSIWDKSDPMTFFLGRYVGCCLAPDSSRFPALVQRRMDTACFMPVVIDAETKEPVALLWMYFAEDQHGHVYLMVNFPEVRYGFKPSTKEALLACQLSFIAQYKALYPGIADVLINNPTYGDYAEASVFKGYRPVENPPGLRKLGGEFVISDNGGPALTENEGFYYLSSLDKDAQLLRYDPKMTAGALAQVQSYPKLAQQILIQVLWSCFESLLIDGALTLATIMAFNEQTKSCGLMGEAYQQVEFELVARLSVVVGADYTQRNLDNIKQEFRGDVIHPVYRVCWLFLPSLYCLFELDKAWMSDNVLDENGSVGLIQSY